MGTYYMCWCNDESVVKKSSSAGIFSVLASCVLEKEGVVFGVERDPDTNELRTTSIESFEEIDRYRRSKYYQSDIREAYMKCGKYLKEGRYVLFSGTPCQIDGLLGFLQGKKTKEEELSHLITADVLCHGLSSYRIYSEYKKSLEKRIGKKIRYIDFRTKDRSWKESSSAKVVFEDGTSQSRFWTEDPYYLGFNRNLTLRPSCYNCPYAAANRISDFSIGDYWGIQEGDVSKKIMYNGVGLTAVNTPKAQMIWEELLGRQLITSERIEVSSAARGNGALVRPPMLHVNRGSFMAQAGKADFTSLINKYLLLDIIKLRIRSGIRMIRKRK